MVTGGSGAGWEGPGIAGGAGPDWWVTDDAVWEDLCVLQLG